MVYARVNKFEKCKKELSHFCKKSHSIVIDAKNCDFNKYISAIYYHVFTIFAVKTAILALSMYAISVKNVICDIRDSAILCNFYRNLIKRHFHD